MSPVDKLPQWAQTALRTGEFPGPQLVEGSIVHVDNMIKVEMERIKAKQHVSKTINWSGGFGSGNVGARASGAFGMTSPSSAPDSEDPSQWIANLATTAANGDDGGSEGGPVGASGETYRGGGRDDRHKEFTLVNPRNINILVFIGKALNSNP